MLSKSWDNPSTEFTFSVLKVRFGGDDISIDTEVWYNVIFWMLVLIGLELPWSSGLGFKAFWEIGGVACWDGL